MKRKISMLMAIVMAFACFGIFAGCLPRENRLIICNWYDYIDMTIFEDFEREYEAETGIKVRVDYENFDDNEVLYTEMKKGNVSYDLICPSDYMIETMISENMLQKLDMSLVPNYNNVDERFRTDENYSAFDPTHEYAVPYFMGTFGIFYNTDKGVTDEDASSWESLRDTKFKGKITMKEATRDSMVLGNIFANIEELTTLAEAGYNDTFRAKLYEVFNVITPASIAATKQVLIDQIKAVDYIPETDNGKNNILRSAAEEALGLYWSCDAAFIMMDAKSGTTNLRYQVPKEGGNVWLDGFVIPEDAVNTKAAHAFINFLCRKDIALRNMEAAGGCSVITEATNELREQYENDDEFFKDRSQEWKEMFIDAFFPGDETLKRCVMMKSFGEMSEAVENAWIDVRKSA